MNPDAIIQAKARLKRAHRAVADLKSATNYEDAEAAWTDLLQAISSIYAKFEQGVKGYGKSYAWFGRKKNKRKTDPLLRYLHFARGADYHGIKKVVGRNKGSNVLGVNRTFNQRDKVYLQAVDQKTLKPIGNPVEGLAAGPCIIAVRAYNDKWKDYCDPPQEHKGQSITPTLHAAYPDLLAEISLPYFESLLEEAEGFVEVK